MINPFLGSGSTLVAAHRTGGVCYGIELDSRYVDLIINRFEQVTGIEAKLTNHSVSHMANAQKTRVLIKRVPTNYETIHQFVARNILENGRYCGALNFCGNNKLSLRAKSVRSRIQTLRRRSLRAALVERLPVLLRFATPIGKSHVSSIKLKPMMMRLATERLMMARSADTQRGCGNAQCTDFKSGGGSKLQ